MRSGAGLAGMAMTVLVVLAGCTNSSASPSSEAPHEAAPASSSALGTQANGTSVEKATPAPGMVIVPDLVGMSVREAKQILEAHELRMNSSVGGGSKVSRQYPEAGMQVRVRSGVSLQTSN